MHAPSEFSKNLLTCSAASSCSTAFFRAFYLRGCESLPLGTEGQTSIVVLLMITEEEISHQNNNIFDLSHPNDGSLDGAGLCLLILAYVHLQHKGNVSINRNSLAI